MKIASITVEKPRTIRNKVNNAKPNKAVTGRVVEEKVVKKSRQDNKDAKKKALKQLVSKSEIEIKIAP